jgi:hypothetical protein
MNQLQTPDILFIHLKGKIQVTTLPEKEKKILQFNVVIIYELMTVTCFHLKMQ